MSASAWMYCKAEHVSAYPSPGIGQERLKHCSVAVVGEKVPNHKYRIISWHMHDGGKIDTGAAQDWSIMYYHSVFLFFLLVSLQ